jgi:hypothetical protein
MGGDISDVRHERISARWYWEGVGRALVLSSLN